MARGNSHEDHEKKGTNFVNFVAFAAVAFVTGPGSQRGILVAAMPRCALWG
jgi:hypothetical protein